MCFSLLCRFVSDFGHDGYKEFCQHKLLQCFNIRSSLCRTYPPCLLEWKAALRRANMALTAKFPDGKFIKHNIHLCIHPSIFATRWVYCRQVCSPRGHFKRNCLETFLLDFQVIKEIQLSHLRFTTS